MNNSVIGRNEQSRTNARSGSFVLDFLFGSFLLYQDKRNEQLTAWNSENAEGIIFKLLIILINIPSYFHN